MSKNSAVRLFVVPETIPQALLRILECLRLGWREDWTVRQDRSTALAGVAVEDHRYGDSGHHRDERTYEIFPSCFRRLMRKASACSLPNLDTKTGHLVTSNLTWTSSVAADVTVRVQAVLFLLMSNRTPVRSRRFKLGSSAHLARE